MDITFLGAARTVTGSKYLLTIDNLNILVDCGLFQGHKELRLRNWQPLPFAPKILDAVILTHAHIDHSGYLPLLVKNGFNGPIFSTIGTYDLCKILLPDSAHLQEEDAYHANKYHYSKHNPALPLYTRENAASALALFKQQHYNQPVYLDKNTSFQFISAGHIIGSSLIVIQNKDKKIVFTGDLGRMHNQVMSPPDIVKQADYLVLESTYGNRLHKKNSAKLFLKKVVNQTINRGGTVIIPAFAVGRSQTILYYLAELKEQKLIPDVPIYLDSPMAINATQILCEHMEDLRLTKFECKRLSDVATYVQSVEQSRAIDADKSPKIIISASGMATGGRILFHLQAYASDEKNVILFTGYQAPGTRGEKILNGFEYIKMHGLMLPIRAEVLSLTSTSAHADYKEILSWLENFVIPPKKTFITHGELDSSLSLQRKIVRKFGWDCMVPKYEQRVSLL